MHHKREREHPLQSYIGGGLAKLCEPGSVIIWSCRYLAIALAKQYGVKIIIVDSLLIITGQDKHTVALCSKQEIQDRSMICICVCEVGGRGTLLFCFLYLYMSIKIYLINSCVIFSFLLVLQAMLCDICLNDRLQQLHSLSQSGYIYV